MPRKKPTSPLNSFLARLRKLAEEAATVEATWPEYTQTGKAVYAARQRFYDIEKAIADAVVADFLRATCEKCRAPFARKLTPKSAAIVSVCVKCKDVQRKKGKSALRLIVSE